MRWNLVYSVIPVTFMVLVSDVFAQSVERDRAWSFREQVGLAAMDLAAMNMPAAVHESLMSAILDHFSADAGSNGLVDDVADAGREVCSRISWGRDPDEAWLELESARGEVLEVFASLAEDSRDMLPANLRIYMDRAIGNLGLDSPYRLLDLTDIQRERILALQRQRDLVLRDARQRVRPARLEAAQQAFETQAQTMLTIEQQAELAQFQANIAANLEAVLDRELADYPEDPTAEDGEGAGQAAAQPKSAPRWTSALIPFLANVSGRFHALLKKLTPSPAAMTPIADAR